METRRIAVVVAVLLALPVLGAGQAAATLFTLEQTIVIDGTETDNPGVLGEIRPVTSLAGTVLAVPQQDGTINFANQDVFVVEIELFGGSELVDQLSWTVVSTPQTGNPVGAGAFDDPGQAPDNVTASPGTSVALFDFDVGNLSAGNLQAGETSTRLFATYEAAGGGMGALSSESPNNAVLFMISSGAFDFNVNGTIIPEPATAVLLAAGLAGLGLAGRRRRSH